MYKALLSFHDQDEPRIVAKRTLKDLRDRILAEAIKNHKQPLKRHWRILEAPQGEALEGVYQNLYSQFRTLQGLNPSQKWMHLRTGEMAYSYGLVGHFKAYNDVTDGTWEPMWPWAPAIKRILHIALTED